MGREGNINVWFLLTSPLLGTWSATQAHALDQESKWRPFDSQAGTQPLSHTSQGDYRFLKNFLIMKFCLSEVQLYLGILCFIWQPCFKNLLLFIHLWIILIHLLILLACFVASMMLLF